MLFQDGTYKYILNYLGVEFSSDGYGFEFSRNGLKFQFSKTYLIDLDSILTNEQVEADIFHRVKYHLDICDEEILNAFKSYSANALNFKKFEGFYNENV